MKSQSFPVLSELARSSILVRVPSPEEVPWFDGLLKDHHYLGAGRSVGDYLRQVVELDGKTVAVLAWGPACYALKDRDLWISWSATQRLERLKLIVQNRRFLVRPAKGESPNLASQAMGAALRVLPEQWGQCFGYRPLLAESFTDPEACAGTCYKASNWEAVGHSAGYSRHRADFYIPKERPQTTVAAPAGAGGAPTAPRGAFAPGLPGRTGGRPFGNTAGQRRATRFPIGCFWPGA